MAREAMIQYWNIPTIGRQQFVSGYPDIGAAIPEAPTEHARKTLDGLCEDPDNKTATLVDYHPKDNTVSGEFTVFRVLVTENRISPLEAVIGATSEIGDHTLIYHGVTPGADVAPDGKRHTAVKSGTTLDANATVLGPIHLERGQLWVQAQS